jgi:hypothetical protein
MKFEAGLREEMLFLDSPQEHFVPAPMPPPPPPGPQQQPGGGGGSAAPDGSSGQQGQQAQQAQQAAAAAGGVMLTSGAALECVYDGVRVVHRGTLRVTFSLLLKAREAAARRGGSCARGGGAQKALLRRFCRTNKRKRPSARARARESRRVWPDAAAAPRAGGGVGVLRAQPRAGAAAARRRFKGAAHALTSKEGPASHSLCVCVLAAPPRSSSRAPRCWRRWRRWRS